MFSVNLKSGSTPWQMSPMFQKFLRESWFGSGLFKFHISPVKRAAIPNLWSWAGANQVSGLVESLPKLGSCHRRFVFLQRKLDSLLWAFPSGFCFWVLRPFSHLFPALFQVAWYLCGSMGTSSESNSINEVRRTDGTARSKYICPWKCKPRDICPRTGVAFLAAFAHGVLGFNVLLNI